MIKLLITSFPWTNEINHTSLHSTVMISRLVARKPAVGSNFQVWVIVELERTTFEWFSWIQQISAPQGQVTEHNSVW